MSVENYYKKTCLLNNIFSKSNWGLNSNKNRNDLCYGRSYIIKKQFNLAFFNDFGFVFAYFNKNNGIKSTSFVMKDN